MEAFTLESTQMCNERVRFAADGAQFSTEVHTCATSSSQKPSSQRSICVASPWMRSKGMAVGSPKVSYDMTMPAPFRSGGRLARPVTRLIRVRRRASPSAGAVALNNPNPKP